MKSSNRKIGMLASAVAMLGQNMPSAGGVSDLAHDVMLKPQKRKGHFPQGKQHKITPPYKNPRGTYVKNAAQGLQMNRQYVAWATKKFGKCNTLDLLGYPKKA